MQLSTSPLPVFATTRLAYGDAWRIIRTFPLIWLASLFFYVVFSRLSEGNSATRSAIDTPLFSAGWALETLALLVSVACIIPAALLSHRLILLGVAERLSQAFHPLERIARYGALEAATILAIELPRELVKSFEAWESVIVFYGVAAFLILLLLGSLGAIVRLAAVYPAIAVDSGRAEVMAAFHATRASFWRILAIAFLTTGPFAAMGIIALISEPGSEVPRITIPWSIIGYTALYGATVMWIAAMSNVYLCIKKSQPLSQTSG